MNLELVFKDRTENIYNSMRSRLKEKRNKKGRVTQEKREVPFNLGELRQWLKQNFFGQFCMTVILCRYCTAAIDVSTFQLDHSTPVSRGGSLGTENLQPCCESCNRLKGKLDAVNFTMLMDFLRLLDAASRSDIVARLKQGAMGMRMRHFGKKKADVTA